MDNQKIIQPQTLKGFRDFLPQEALKREYLRTRIKEVFELYGFDPIETPAVEYLDTFTGQIGEEEKLFFKFQDQGGRWVALRFDQTVPTCRLVAQYPEKIIFPFKRYQIQNAWRAEKPQKGRYREFMQCDGDIFGVERSEADAETIALSMDIFRHLGFTEIKTLINDRSLYEGIPYSVISAIDKLKKIGRENVIAEIVNKGYLKIDAENFLEKILNFKPTEKIQSILNYLKCSGFPPSWYQFEPTIARSFSYSNGPIWEIEIPNFNNGSVLGGERYDNLVGRFSKQNVPGTGFGLGFDRTLDAMEKLNLLPNLRTKTQILVTVFSQDLLELSIKTCSYLRNKKINTEIYPDPTAKLEKQLKYADKKGIPYVVILGPEESANETIKLKNLAERKEITILINELVNNIK